MADQTPDIGATNLATRTPISDSSENHEACKNVIRTLYKVLVTDHGDRFLSQFRGQSEHGVTPATWKARMYKRLYGCSPQDILDGYEGLADSLDRMPTADEIVKSIKSLKRSRRDKYQSGKTTADRELKFSGGISGYVEALAKINADNSTAMCEIAKMRELLVNLNPVVQIDTERKKRIAEAQHELASLLLKKAQK